MIKLVIYFAQIKFRKKLRWLDKIKIKIVYYNILMKLISTIKIFRNNINKQYLNNSKINKTNIKNKFIKKQNK